MLFTIAPSAPRNVKIEEKSATSLLVTWKPPEYPNGIIERYRILYSDNSGKNYSTAGITKGLQNETLFYLLSGLKEDTEYKIYVSSLLYNNYLSTCTFQGTKFIFGFGSTCVTYFYVHCWNFRCRVKNFRAQLQILGAPTPKECLITLRKSNPGFVLQYGPILAVSNTAETNENQDISHKSLRLRY